MKAIKVTSKPHDNNAPIPDCLNCITFAICKSKLSTCRNFDESMIAMDELTNKCSILFRYAMDHYHINNPANGIRSYFTLNEDRAIKVFEIIIPRIKPI